MPPQDLTLEQQRVHDGCRRPRRRVEQDSDSRSPRRSRARRAQIWQPVCKSSAPCSERRDGDRTRASDFGRFPDFHDSTRDCAMVNLRFEAPAARRRGHRRKLISSPSAQERKAATAWPWRRFFRWLDGRPTRRSAARTRTAGCLRPIATFLGVELGRNAQTGWMPSRSQAAVVRPFRGLTGVIEARQQVTVPVRFEAALRCFEAPPQARSIASETAAKTRNYRRSARFARRCSKRCSNRRGVSAPIRGHLELAAIVR